MKKLLVIMWVLLAGMPSFAWGPRNVNEKVLQVFNTSFPHASCVSWETLTGTYVVTFVESGIRSRIVYDSNGGINSFIRYYQEENLPVNVRLLLRRSYRNYSIFGVVEVSARDNGSGGLRTAYLVKLLNGKYWMTVRTDEEGNMELMEKYRNAL